MCFVDKINYLRKTDISNFKTNYFTPELNNPELIFETANAIIFLIKEKTFYKLFFAYNNIKDFQELLNKLPKFEIYLEIVSKTKLDTELKSALEEYFEYKTTYQKLYKKLNTSEDRTFPACKVNTNLIYEKIYSTFDIYFEHLMSKDELEKFKCENKILTVYENNEMKSFLIYKTQGSKAYLNHIANYGTKNNLIELWQIFYEALNYNGIKYVDLWYNMQNKKAENMYRIEQFQPLNIFNFCYKKN